MPFVALSWRPSKVVVVELGYGVDPLSYFVISAGGWPNGRQRWRENGLFEQGFDRFHPSNQLSAERRSVRRLLDLLIERQLAQRLDSLFAGNDAVGLGALFERSDKSQDWQDLGGVVARTLGLPSGGIRPSSHDTASLERLDYFARGDHRTP